MEGRNAFQILLTCIPWWLPQHGQKIAYLAAINFQINHKVCHYIKHSINLINIIFKQKLRSRVGVEQEKVESKNMNATFCLNLPHLETGLLKLQLLTDIIRRHQSIKFYWCHHVLLLCFIKSFGVRNKPFCKCH